MNDKRRYRKVLDKMLQSIDSGEFPEGGRLPPERELAERFTASRPTVREAIVALEVLDRVQVKPGSGVYVRTGCGKGTYPGISAFELTEARAMIEGEAAALAAKMITPEELHDLETTLKDMATESADGTLVSEQADKRFHQIIAHATGNAMLASIVDTLWHVRDNNPEVHQAYQAICETDPQARVDEHKGILKALRKRDSAAARTEMHRHFSRILDRLISVQEEMQMQEINMKTREYRQRFSLDHLLVNQP